MRDRGIICAGLAVLLAAAGFPVWHNLAGKAGTDGPKLARPANSRQCVAPTAFMRTSHMDLLIGWREDVVRRGGREFVAPDGSRYRMSLTGTCLQQCHGSKQEFCDRCHAYAAVAPSCWNCHLDAKSAVVQAKASPGPAQGGPR